MAQPKPERRTITGKRQGTIPENYSRNFKIHTVKTGIRASERNVPDGRSTLQTTAAIYGKLVATT